MSITYSLHKIVDPDSLSFSAAEYSRFKFGDGSIAAKFGRDLARGFIREKLAKTYKGTQIVVVSSPYSFIPTATFFMKNHFVYELNRWLAGNSYPVTQETKIYRTKTYQEDYGELNAEERMNLIGNDNFYIDKTFIKDKLVIFIDDIRITGSHEKMIVNMLAELNIREQHYLLYFAELMDNRVHPSIENRLNYAHVKSLFNLDEIIYQDTFCINTRIVKYILNAKEDIFRLFMDDKGEEFLRLVLNMTIGNSYHLIEAYKPNFLYLQNLIEAKELNTIDNGN